MRLAVSLLLLSCVGCDDAPNRQEFTNLSIAQLNDHDRITELATGAKPGMGTLASDVAALREQVASQAATITKLQSDLAAAQQQLTTATTLHRIGPDREDLGIGAPGSTWVWIPEGEVNLASLWTVYYKTGDCTGPGFPANGLGQGQLALTPTGEVISVDVTSVTAGGEWKSQQDRDTKKCEPATDPLSQSAGYAKWSTVAHLPPIPFADTHLEKR